MKKILLFSIAIISFIFLISNCQVGNNGIIIPTKPYEKLSQYQFFRGNLADLKPNDRVIPYDLNSPLFSDYARKARFVWMPEGTTATYTEGRVLDFPDGAVLIKNFYYENDETDASKGRRIMETRLLVNRNQDWEAIGYIWNEEQTEAIHEVVGDIKEVSWVNTSGQAQTTNYIIPNKNQCKSCHSHGKQQIPIGPKVRNLNKTFIYADGEINQLDKWASVGYLSGYDITQRHPKVATWDQENTGTLHERTMAYLDINCAHCHNPTGSANTSGLHLTVNNPLDLNLGIYKATVSAGAGTGGFTYSIVPGNPEESIMIYRMSSSNPGAMMPELGRSLVHMEGVALVSKWIKNMEVDKEIMKSAKLQ